MKILAGAQSPTAHPFAPFSDDVLDFFDAISRAARKIPPGAPFRDEIGAFGFWCRRGRIERVASRYATDARIGRGVVVHIAASNVPLLFAYSMALGLLAGCPCAIRVSTRAGGADERFCAMLDDILRAPEYAAMRDRISVFTCARDSAALRSLMAEAAGCVVWGGDDAVLSIRSIPMRADAVRIEFPDRWSMCMIDPDALTNASDDELRSLARRFYNDTYAMDQNACSSPRLVIWTRADEHARERWWSAVAREAEGYVSSARRATMKYEDACRAIMTLDRGCRLERRSPALWIARLDELPRGLPDLAARFGTFFEHACSWRDALRSIDDRRLQTVTTLGVSPSEVARYAAAEGMSGLHRAVSIGSAMELDTVWDGHDVINELSRAISFENTDSIKSKKMI